MEKTENKFMKEIVLVPESEMVSKNGPKGLVGRIIDYVETGKTIEQCRKAHWLDNSKDILANEKLINDTVALLQEEKKRCEQTQA